MTVLDIIGNKEVVTEIGSTVRSVIDDLFGWLPNRKSENELKQKELEVKQVLSEELNKLNVRELDLKQAAMESEAKLREVEFSLRVAVLTSKAGQFIVYGFGGVTLLQLILIYLVYPFLPSMPVLTIPMEQWALLFGVLGMEKFADLKMRTANKTGGVK